jgi:hypothetical protein
MASVTRIDYPEGHYEHCPEKVGRRVKIPTDTGEELES